MTAELTQLMFFQIRAGDTGMYGFALGIVFVFLALAALYESWSLPLAVILVVPLCLLSSVVGVLAGHQAVNLFVQIGLVVLVGLACKNAILIVEFARGECAAGQGRNEAILEACRRRLRPILMTSLTLILGVLPLVLVLGGRGGDAPLARFGRLQRHDRRDALRPVADTGVFSRPGRCFLPSFARCCFAPVRRFRRFGHRFPAGRACRREADASVVGRYRLGRLPGPDSPLPVLAGQAAAGRPQPNEFARIAVS